MKSEQRAILTQQVRRVKPSLAGMSYRLEPGEVVYITQWLGRSVRASEVSDPSQRISEDYFDLDFGTFTLETDKATHRLTWKGYCAVNVEAASRETAIALAIEQKPPYIPSGTPLFYGLAGGSNSGSVYIVPTDKDRDGAMGMCSELGID